MMRVREQMDHLTPRGIWRGLVGFGLFWYRFIVGDDWRIAVAIAVGLAGTWGLHQARVTAWWLLPVVVVASTWMTLARRSRRARG